jgi:hypothetical protein
MRSVDPDPESGSKRAKITHKIEEKKHVLSAGCSLQG